MSRHSTRKVPLKDLPTRIKTLFHSDNPFHSKKLERIHESPNVFLVRNFLSEAELKHFDKFCTNRCAVFKNSVSGVQCSVTC
jgi:hypothetical protein